MDSETIKFPKRIISHYIDNLKGKIKVDGVFLFGSFAYGNPTKHSDVDLAVISRNFNRKDFDKRLDLLFGARDKISCQIAMDVIGYTPKEFSNIEKYSAIMAHAKKHGKWIYRGEAVKNEISADSKNMELKTRYNEEIKKLSDVIQKKYKPEKIILFGSCAYGEIKPASDIDMLIIKDSRKRSIDRIKEVLFLTDNDLPFEPLVYSSREIKTRLDKGDFFLRNILNKGKVLYEKRTV